MIPLLRRAITCRCPRCGKGKLFEKWGTMVTHCSECGFAVRSREEQTWFFMYMSTAFVTGLFVIALLLMEAPKAPLFAKIIIGAISFIVFLLTQPMRKGLAIAMEYWIEERTKKWE